MKRRLTIALAGNPNSGKTTIFNNLTGARRHVGNYPGVTVEKAEGSLEFDSRILHIVDLPGTYSLTAYSIEEMAARDFILHEKPDVVIHVIDASNLERNLYLTVQLIELGAPLVLAFNMSDAAKARGVEFDLKRLSSLWGAPIVPTVGHRGHGMKDLLRAAVERAENGFAHRAPEIRYGEEIDRELALIRDWLEARGAVPDGRTAAWTALKLLEKDKHERKKIAAPELDELLAQCEARLQAILGDSPEILIAERRYGFISGACQEAVRSSVEARHDFSDRIDAFATHPALSLPIFLGLMYLTFQLTFTAAAPLAAGIEAALGWASETILAHWRPGQEDLLRSLIVEGVIGGVGGVLVFLPNILLLFMAIAFLEDTGYMARAAFIMDRWMHKIGLHGKSFIPMLVAFGCSVPAILATRALESRRDRLATMFVIPLMSCGARLAIFALIIPAFFPLRWRAPMLWLFYLIGIGAAILLAKLLRNTVLRGEAEPFIMELPPYRLPTARGLALHAWTRGWMYIRKAGTVILAFSIALWALSAFPRQTEYSRDFAAAIASAEETGQADLARSLERERQSERLTHSAAGRIGAALRPVLDPMGFDWRIGTALLGAFAAKEIFVAQLGVLFAVGDVGEESAGSLRERIRAEYPPLVGFCVMLFCLLGLPCMATVAATWRESGSWRWAAAQFAALTGMAWLVTTAMYQAGRLLGIGI